MAHQEQLDQLCINTIRMLAADAVQQGGYVLTDPQQGTLQVILIATGSEVAVALGAQKLLAGKGVAARVVSLPSWELFDRQPQTYRDTVLPPAVTARVAIEAGVPLGWHRYVGPGGDVVGMTRFGAAAPGPVLFERFGFTAENVAARALAILAR